MSACCSRKKSENDCLRDDEDGKRYCGSCWQAWVRKESASRKRPRIAVAACAEDARSEDLTSAAAAADGRVLFDDDEQVGELEGVLLPGTETFVLVSRKLGVAFSPERSDDGRLRRIGTVGGDDAVVLDPAEEPRAAATDEFPFAVDAADHCETPFRAYADIAPVLEWLARAMGKEKRRLRVYDPYYCDGAVKRNLARLGFGTCYNEREDFYARVAADTVPEFDVLVTNPPYAATLERDHVESLLKFVASKRLPFFILQPNYCYVKPYYERIVSSLKGGPRLVFLQPPLPRDYVYESPEGFREVKSARRKTAPYITFWYCWLGPAIQGQFIRDYARGEIDCPRLTLACSEFFLGDSFKDSGDKTRKRNRNKNGKRPRAA